MFNYVRKYNDTRTARAREPVFINSDGIANYEKTIIHIDSYRFKKLFNSKSG